MTRKTMVAAILLSACAVSGASTVGAGSTKAPCAAPAASLTGTRAPRVQVALLLDTSNSMDGLIDQARSQLWSVVNEFAAARRLGRPVELQVALYEYGNNRLSPQKGYVRQVLPFTTDLDRLSEELFALTTFGGEEYCGTVIQAALDQLRWSPSPADLKVVFIAGNEPFTQGPVDFRGAAARARALGVVVNTVHCGPPAVGSSTGWSEGARLAYGTYSAFDQDRAVAHVPAPQDDEIARLGVELNRTYVPYGAHGHAGQARQRAQDENAAEAKNKGAEVSRALTKATLLYNNSNWDLVDAVKNRQVDLEGLKAVELPSEMQKLNAEGRRAFIESRSRERAQIQARIQELEKERRQHLAQVRRADAASESLDTVMVAALRDQAACRGFELQ